MVAKHHPLSAADATLANLGVRSISVVCDEVRIEADGTLHRPVKQAAAYAVLHNPWLGTDQDADLAPDAERIAPILAKALSDRLILALDGASSIEAFGKAALVGLDGEIEHAGALIHTPYFGNIVRELLQGTSVLCFADGRSQAGADIRVPLWHKTHATSRQYYQTMEVHLPEAPHPGEICVIAAASNGPRPFPRIGDRTTDRPITTEILEGLLS